MFLRWHGTTLMTRILKILTLSVVLCLCTIQSFAQGNSNGNGNGGGNGYAFGLGVNIPEVSIIALRSNQSTSISLGLDGPAEAGLGATNTMGQFNMGQLHLCQREEYPAKSKDLCKNRVRVSAKWNGIERRSQECDKPWKRK